MFTLDWYAVTKNGNFSNILMVRNLRLGLFMSEKKKSVLVGTYYLNYVGGSQLYTYDLITELKARDDIDVEFFAIELGDLSAYMQDKLGVSFMGKDKYDLILASHNVTVEALYKKGPIIQICHGAILGLEFPSPYADYHVGITKEVCDSLDEKGFDNALILNGLDLHQKRPTKPLNRELKKVLSLSQSEEANAMLRNVCDTLGLDFLSFNKHKNPTFHIEERINEADLVVGIGRSVYDAMACGRPCVVFDSRDYNGNKGDGYLHPDLFNDFVQANCSGRYLGKHFSEAMLIDEFRKYNPDHGAELRKIAEEHLNVEKTAVSLLAVPAYITPDTQRKKRRRINKVRIKEAKARFKRSRKAFKRRLKRLLGIASNPR